MARAIAPTASRPAAEALVMELLRVPGGSGRELAISQAIERRLKDVGVPSRSMTRDSAHKKSPFGGQCGSLILRLPGSRRRRAEPQRLLMAHMDTVPLAVGCRPLRRGRRVVPASAGTGLGADDRSGCAAILWAAIQIAGSGLSHPPLTFLWTVQEELALAGSRFVDVGKLGDPAMGFNFDGGDPARLTIGATGAYRMDIEVRGIASHAGVHPEDGVSAAAIAALAIADLQRRGWHGLVERGGLRGTSNVGVIQGGEATNVVTDRLIIKAEARAHDRKLRRRIVSEYRGAFERAARSVRNAAGQRGRVRLGLRHDYESFKLSAGEPCVAEARRMAEMMGLKVDYRVANGGLDANWFNEHAIPTVSLGCGQHEIHTTREWLDLDEYWTACRLALAIATGEHARNGTRR